MLELYLYPRVYFLVILWARLCLPATCVFSLKYKYSPPHPFSTILSLSFPYWLITSQNFWKTAFNWRIINTNKQINTQTNKQTNTQTHKQTNKHTNKQINKQTNKHTNTRTNKHTQTNKQTNKQTNT